MKIVKNIGPKNRIARAIAGVIFLILSVLVYSDSIANQVGAVILVVLGLAMLWEAYASHCLWHGIRGTSDMR